MSLCSDGVDVLHNCGLIQFLIHVLPSCNEVRKKFSPYTEIKAYHRQK